MKIEVDFSKLRAAAAKIGAKEPEGWSLADTLLDQRNEIRLKLQKGIDVDIHSVEANEGGLLTYQGQQILLYIMDHGHYAWQALNVEGKGNRFHVADCSTLDRMRTERRFERYVATNNTSGVFRVTGHDREGELIDGTTHLHVCQNCLKMLNYKGFRNLSHKQRQTFVKQFDLDDFFATYVSYFDELPTRKDDGPIEDYGPDWSDISFQYRKSLGWSCERCDVNLREHHHLLHTHHISGVKNNHHTDNLEALCLDCHSKQPGHHGMFVSRKDRMLINKLRRNDRPVLHNGAKWEDVLKFGEPAVQGLLLEYRKQGRPAPEVGYEFIVGNEVIAEVDLAWEENQNAVALTKGAETQIMETHGWSVYTPAEFLDAISN